MVFFILFPPEIVNSQLAAAAVVPTNVTKENSQVTLVPSA